MRLRWIACAAVVVLMGGCDDPVSPLEGSFVVAIHAGDQQQGPATSILGQPLQVVVTDAGNAPVQNVVVIFRLAGAPANATGANAAKLTDSIGVTGLDGVAGTTIRLGAITGSYTVHAALQRSADRAADFTMTATPAATLASVTPSTVRSGDTVVLRGARFNTSVGGNVVQFGTASGRITSLSGDSLIQAVVPACVAAGPVQVRVAVGTAATNEVPVTYAASSTTLQLALGEAMTVSSAELESCLRLQGNGPRYLVVPQFATSAAAPAALSFAITRITPTSALASSPFGFDAAASSLVSAPPPLVAAPQTRSAQADFDWAMRQLEAKIAPAAAAQAKAAGLGELGRAQLLGVPSPPPALNSTRSFQVLSNLQSAQFKSVTASLRYAGSAVLIYVDQQTSSGLSDADLRRVGQLFDDQLYAIDVNTFGSESDLDANGRVVVLMTPVVNSLVTAAECTSSGAVAGYFYPNDLLLNNQNSNRGEIFYTLVPDPAGTVSCSHSAASVLDVIPPTFIHEFQHMISFNQHVLIRGGTSEDVWLNEGLSLMAEELGGRSFEERYPAPFGRTNPFSVFPDSALLMENGVLVNAYRYLRTSSQVSITTIVGYGSLAERGAAWLFLRWLADQKGNGILGQLVQTRLTSVHNIEDKSGEAFESLFGDFSIAVAADIPGFVRSSLSMRHRFPSRDFTRIFADIAIRNNLGSSSPVSFTQLTTTAPASSGSMQYSTMSFFSLPTVGSATSVTVRFSQGNTAPFPTSFAAQVGLVRVQ